jgi:hypothetical protein
VWWVKGLRDWTLVTTPSGDNTTSASGCFHPHLSHQFLLDLFLYLFRIN